MTARVKNPDLFKNRKLWTRAIAVGLPIDKIKRRATSTMKLFLSLLVAVLVVMPESSLSSRESGSYRSRDAHGVDRQLQTSATGSGTFSASQNQTSVGSPWPGAQAVYEEPTGNVTATDTGIEDTVIDSGDADTVTDTGIEDSVTDSGAGANSIDENEISFGTPGTDTPAEATPSGTLYEKKSKAPDSKKGYALTKSGKSSKSGKSNKSGKSSKGGKGEEVGKGMSKKSKSGKSDGSGKGKTKSIKDEEWSTTTGSSSITSYGIEKNPISDFEYYQSNSDPSPPPSCIECDDVETHVAYSTFHGEQDQTTTATTTTRRNQALVFVGMALVVVAVLRLLLLSFASCRRSEKGITCKTVVQDDEEQDAKVSDPDATVADYDDDEKW